SGIEGRWNGCGRRVAGSQEVFHKATAKRRWTPSPTPWGRRPAFGGVGVRATPDCVVTQEAARRRAGTVSGSMATVGGTAGTTTAGPSRREPASQDAGNDGEAMAVPARGSALGDAPARCLPGQAGTATHGTVAAAERAADRNAEVAVDDALVADRQRGDPVLHAHAHTQPVAARQAAAAAGQVGHGRGHRSHLADAAILVVQ